MPTVDQVLALFALDGIDAEVYADRLAVVRRDPQPDEANIPLATAISFLLVDLEADPGHLGDVDMAFEVTVDGTSVATYAGGVLTPIAPWVGTVDPSTPADPFVWWDVRLERVGAPFDSDTDVEVVLDAAVVGGWGAGPWGHFPWGHPPAYIPAQFPWTFHTADLTPPRLLSATALDAETVRVTFDDAMATDGAGSVLAVAAWSFVARNVDPLPGVALDPVAVAPVDGSGGTQFDVTVGWEQTPACAYDVTAGIAVTDSSGNVIDPAYRTAAFVGFVPEPVPGRRFEVWPMMVPVKNRIEDATRDLERFVNCIEEPLALLLREIDAFPDQFDPDRCSEAVIDAMLYDLGNPFEWAGLELTALERRKLLRVLVQIYGLKGTAQGIEALCWFLLGVRVIVVPYQEECWLLGVDELGSGSIAEVLSDLAEPFDFSAAPLAFAVAVDGVPRTCTFLAGDFAAPAAGTAAEVAAVLGSRLTGAGARAVAQGMPASMDSLPERFAIAGGDDLLLEVDGVPATVTFHATDFAALGSGTAAEVCARLTADVSAINAADVGGVAQVRTHTRGPAATLRVTGGTAAAALGFPAGPVVGTSASQVALYSQSARAGAAIEVAATGNPANAVIGFATERAAAIGGAVLGLSDRRARYSFDLEIAAPLAPEVEVLVRRVAEYLKPAHTHLVNVRTAPTPPWPDVWMLGIDELDVGTILDA